MVSESNVRATAKDSFILWDIVRQLVPTTEKVVERLFDQHFSVSQQTNEASKINLYRCQLMHKTKTTRNFANWSTRKCHDCTSNIFWISPKELWYSRVMNTMKTKKSMVKNSLKKVVFNLGVFTPRMICFNKSWTTCQRHVSKILMPTNPFAIRRCLMNMNRMWKNNYHR